VFTARVVMIVSLGTLGILGEQWLLYGTKISGYQFH
jgi:hypothetical protein